MKKKGHIYERCIVLFVKSPGQAPVKSRLAAALGKETARRLYRHFVLDMLMTLADLRARGRCDLAVCVYPAGSTEAVRAWLGDGYPYLSQRGHDLGERMKNAFQESFAAGYKQALLIGSDAPDLTGEILEDGFARLEQEGAVIGPACDGGYYLIGFQAGAFLPQVFDGMPWSSGEVFARTLETFHQQKRDVAILTPWRDMDTLEDLRDLYERHRSGSFANSRTMRCLRRKKILSA